MFFTLLYFTFIFLFVSFFGKSFLVLDETDIRLCFNRDGRVDENIFFELN